MSVWLLRKLGKVVEIIIESLKAVELSCGISHFIFSFGFDRFLHFFGNQTERLCELSWKSLPFFRIFRSMLYLKRKQKKCS